MGVDVTAMITLSDIFTESSMVESLPMHCICEILFAVKSAVLEDNLIICFCLMTEKIFKRFALA